MKREAPTHTKMKRFCRLLHIDLYEAVGILELLWHLTAREAPRGDIGKLSNEDIAVFLEYPNDENELITALVRAGWLDEDEEHRLLVHDWHIHADEAVKKKLARSDESFILSRRVETAASHVETELQSVSTKRDLSSLRARAGPEPVPGGEPDTHAPLVRRKSSGDESSDDDERAGARKSSSSSSARKTSSGDDVCVSSSSILRTWNDNCEPEFRRVKDTPTRRNLLRICIKRHHVTAAMIFEAVQNLKSYGGNGVNGWRPSFDWLVQHDTIVKTLDGVYGKAKPMLGLRDFTLVGRKPQ